AEVPEGLRAPAEERVPLLVALVLDRRVLQERRDRAELVHLDRVVDHEIRRLERVDPVRVAPERSYRLAHRREVDHRGHAGEILEKDARRVEGYLLRGDGGRIPLEQ